MFGVWAQVFLIAVIAVYGYIITLSLWAMRVQLAAARTRHHPRDHPAMFHIFERVTHKGIAVVLIGSLAVRVDQLTIHLTPWLLVPLTVLAATLTTRVLAKVWRMAAEDMNSWYVGGLNRLKTVVLLMCVAGVFLDQIWRIVTLFWF
jgi:hypothetical protein